MQILANKRNVLRLGAVAGLMILNIMMMAWVWNLFADLSELKLNWDKRAEVSLEKAAALAGLERAMGYGGFIHNFKNHVIRRSDEYERRTRASLKETLIALDNLKHLLATVEERQRVEAIKWVIDDYRHKFELSLLTEKKHLSPTELDREVYVDDTTALAALSAIRKDLLPKFREQIVLNKMQVDNAWQQVLIGVILMAVVLFASMICLPWLMAGVSGTERN